MNPTLDTIQQQVQGIIDRLDAMNSSSTIPREIETALRERLGSIKNLPGGYTSTAIGGSSAFNLPNVTGTIPVIINGKTYNFLYQ